MTRKIHGFFLIAAILFASPCVAEESPKKLSPEQIAKLIEQLGSSDFTVRETANRQLREMEEALPALRHAAQSADPEVRRRAKEVVAALENKLSERFLRQAVTRVNEEGLDLFIDRMVLQKDYANELRWKTFVELARALSKQAEKFGAAVPNILDRDWLRMGETTTITAGDLHGTRVRLDGVEKTINSLSNCLFVSSGSLDDTYSVYHSILFVDGDIKSINTMRYSILICSGNIGRFTSTRDNIIFCNGDINRMSTSANNAIFVRGELHDLLGSAQNVIEAKKYGRDNSCQANTFLNRKERNAGNSIKIPNARPDKYSDAKPSVLTLFQFFDPVRAGLTHSMIAGDARIDKLTAGKPFARAGLRKDDRILAVDRTKFVTADAFSRLLRRRIMAGKTLLKVQRGDRILEIPVVFEP